jgi:membrane protein implicated in regulation of membrane protease activity
VAVLILIVQIAAVLAAVLSLFMLIDDWLALIIVSVLVLVFSVLFENYYRNKLVDVDDVEEGVETDAG